MNPSTHLNLTFDIRSPMKSTRLILISSLVAVLPSMGAVRLPKIFSDNMMLQRDMPIHVWGWADPAEVVAVDLSGTNAKATTTPEGTWSVELPAKSVGENLELVVSGSNHLVVKNIIMGDIWVCSGQSNMEMSLQGCLGAAEDIKAAAWPKIRRIKFARTSSGWPERDAPAARSWDVCSPETVPNFTAVGFYFAREVQKQTGVPIGIVDTNWGGTRIEPWISPDGLEAVPELAAASAAKQKAIDHYRQQLPMELARMDQWLANTKRQLSNGSSVTEPPVITPPPSAGWSNLYHAMIHPIVRFPIKGALWYQGEANGSEGMSYFYKMQALIGGWRHQWNQGDFPFYFAQLASFDDATEDPAGPGWANIREAQAKAQSIPNTGMAVIIDTVPLAETADIHPKNKFDVGARLARLALAHDYQQSIEFCGPQLKSFSVEGDKIHLSFTHVGTGLMIGNKQGRKPATESNTDSLKQFSIAGSDQKWFPANAVIENDKVTVSSPQVKEPVAVRYAFCMNPAGANLYNREGLPASPFRTDDWKSTP